MQVLRYIQIRLFSWTSAKSSPALGRSDSRLREKDCEVDMRNGKESKLEGNRKDEGNGNREIKEGNGNRNSLYDEHKF